MRHPRRTRVLAALAGAILSAAFASASPGISPEVIQCNGSYTAGTYTHAPYTMPLTVQAVIQDSVGLRVGTPNGVTGTRMGKIPSVTYGLWQFDAAVDISSGCSTVNSIATYTYTLNESNGSPPVIVGQCLYNSNAGCTGTTLNATLQTPMNSSCPGTPPGVGAGAVSLFTPSAHFADAGNAVATFNGVQFGSVPFNSSNGIADLPATYTLSAWVKSGTNAQQRVISAESPSSGGKWAFGLNGNGVWLYDSRDASPDNTLSAAPFGINLIDGAWHKIDVVRINANGTGRRYYADGKLLGTTVATSTSSFNTHSIGHAVMFGRSESGANVFTGDVDEVRVLFAAPTDDDILLEYYGTINRYAADGVHFSSAAGSFSPAAGNGTTAAQHYFPGQTPTAASAWVYLSQSTNTASSSTSQIVLNVDSSLPVAPDATPTPNTTAQISWSWGAPSTICVSPGTPGSGPYYQLASCASGAAVTAPSTIFEPARLIAETYGGPANQLVCRRLKLTDVWGSSPLSLPATAYTLAAAPSGLAFTPASISTGGFVATWNGNGNSAFTRYEMTYALDPAFTVSLATRAALANNLTATTAELTGLTPGTTYYVRVRAFSGSNSDFYGGIPTAFASGSVVTIAGAPTLVGVALSNASVQWSWSSAPGATGYKLFDSSNLSVPLYSGPNTTASVGSLGVNTRYDAEVEADMPAPTAPTVHGHANVYTWANAPVSLAASGIGFSTVTFTWGANGNPGATAYEVAVASDPAFGLVVSTLNTSVGTSVTATGLFPGSTYYVRVRAYNGSQIPTAFAPSINISMVSDIAIATAAAPASPYTPILGLAGSWQFDEGSGLTTADLLGGNSAAPGAFGCVTAACASTPTFTAGPPGLGTAASFSGLFGGVVRTASGANYLPVGAGSITLEAWVNPLTAAQQNGAGIAAIGKQNTEDIALDVSGGVFRLLVSNGAAELSVKVATATIVPGQWTHVVGVLDASHSTATLYLNGKTAAVLNGAPARQSHGDILDIGNRRDSGGNYSYAFSGAIDALRVFNRALSAAEVQAEYSGGFTSSVTAANSGVTVSLPPNAFGAPAQIYITADPVNHPIRVSLAALNAGLASPPAGLTLVPNSVVEVVPVVNGVAFTSTLGSSATLSIPYQDSNNDNLIDGTNPPLAASKALMYTLNTTVNRWEILPTTVDGASRKASGMTPHFSVFALFAPATLGSGLGGVTIYPVPWKPGSGGRFDGLGVTFARLPISGRIRILTLSGQKVRDFSYSGAGAGSAVWDGTNDNGLRAASGVYMARITSDADGSVSVLKFAIER
ncbi:MAG: LamG-like jellyroll fold domain-containing protein [Elusimicrobiota bacterium]